MIKTHLQDLKNREKVFLKPVFEKPDQQVLICDIWVEERLVPEIPIQDQHEFNGVSFC